MSEFVMPKPEDMETRTTNPATKPGWMHVGVVSVESPVKKKDGEIQPNIDARLTLKILNHNDQDQIGKTVGERLIKPQPTHNDGGLFCSVRMARWAQSLGILPPAQPGQTVSINWHDAKGKQALIFTEVDEYNDNEGKPKSRIQIAGAKVWNVHDPEPRAAGAIVAEKFAAKVPNPFGDQQPPAQPTPAPEPDPQPATAAAASEDDMFGGLMD